MVESMKWRVITARGVGSALAAMEKYCPQVIVCDSELLDAGSWRDLLPADIEQPAFELIVVSSLADDRLWAEVLNLGGFDVLSIPFSREEVERALWSALRHFTPPLAVGT